MTITYCRNDPVSSRWSGVGRLLTEFEVDYNFYQHETRLTAAEASITVNVSIGTITQPTSTTLLFTMTNGSTQGPFTLPVSTFRDRGAWAPSMPYLANDTFTANGNLYRVLVNHTSASTFSPTANDGAGHDYYASMMSNPGSSLPTGGATGMVLNKSSGTDYAVSWGYKLPTGGTQYQVLMKNSGTNQDATWQNIGGTHVSFTGSTASRIISTNVSDAIEEVEADVQTLSASISASLSGLTFRSLSDVNFSTADPHTGAIIYYGIGGFWLASAAPSTGDMLSWNGSAWVPVALDRTITDTIQFVIDGGGATITTGIKGYIEVPFACTITQAAQLADQSGSIVVNVYKCAYSVFDGGVTHPAVGDKITASAPPTISASAKSKDTTLTGWTTSIAAGDILAFNVDSVTSIQRVTLSLKVTR